MGNAGGYSIPQNLLKPPLIPQAYSNDGASLHSSWSAGIFLSFLGSVD